MGECSHESTDNIPERDVIRELPFGAYIVLDVKTFNITVRVRVEN